MAKSEYVLISAGTDSLSCKPCVFHYRRISKMFSATFDCAVRVDTTNGIHIAPPCGHGDAIRLVHRLTGQEVKPEDVVKQYKESRNANL